MIGPLLPFVAATLASVAWLAGFFFFAGAQAGGDAASSQMTAMVAAGALPLALIWLVAVAAALALGAGDALRVLRGLLVQGRRTAEDTEVLSRTLIRVQDQARRRALIDGMDLALRDLLSHLSLLAQRLGLIDGEDAETLWALTAAGDPWAIPNAVLASAEAHGPVFVEAVAQHLAEDRIAAAALHRLLRRHAQVTQAVTDAEDAQLLTDILEDGPLGRVVSLMAEAKARFARLVGLAPASGDGGSEEASAPGAAPDSPDSAGPDSADPDSAGNGDDAADSDGDDTAQAPPDDADDDAANETGEDAAARDDAPRMPPRPRAQEASAPPTRAVGRSSPPGGRSEPSRPQGAAQRREPPPPPPPAPQTPSAAPHGQTGAAFPAGAQPQEAPRRVRVTSRVSASPPGEAAPRASVPTEPRPRPSKSEGEGGRPGTLAGRLAAGGSRGEGTTATPTTERRASPPKSAPTQVKEPPTAAPAESSASSDPDDSPSAAPNALPAGGLGGEEPSQSPAEIARGLPYPPMSPGERSQIQERVAATLSRSMARAQDRMNNAARSISRRQAGGQPGDSGAEAAGAGALAGRTTPRQPAAPYDPAQDPPFDPSFDPTIDGDPAPEAPAAGTESDPAASWGWDPESLGGGQDDRPAQAPRHPRPGVGRRKPAPETDDSR